MSNLNGDPDAFRQIREFVDEEHGGGDQKFQLLLRKLCILLFTSDEHGRLVLDETALPPIEAFYDDLDEQPYPASNYAHVKMWEVFGMESMKDLLELHVKLDVLQLDAVFRRYRKEALHFYTAPGLLTHQFIVHRNLYI